MSFLVGNWRGVGRVLSVTEHLKPVFYYIEELTISRQGGAQLLWLHRQTWKCESEEAAQRGEKGNPLNVESGVIKVSPADQKSVEASFIHPFSVTEVSLGELGLCGADQDEHKGKEVNPETATRLSLSSTQEAESFRRGPFAKGKVTQEFHRVYEVCEGDKDKIRYLFKLKSDSMEAAWDHLACELERVE